MCMCVRVSAAQSECACALRVWAHVRGTLETAALAHEISCLNFRAFCEPVLIDLLLKLNYINVKLNEFY